MKRFSFPILSEGRKIGKIRRRKWIEQKPVTMAVRPLPSIPWVTCSAVEVAENPDGPLQLKIHIFVGKEYDHTKQAQTGRVCLTTHCAILFVLSSKFARDTLISDERVVTRKWCLWKLENVKITKEKRYWYNYLRSLYITLLNFKINYIKIY